MKGFSIPDFAALFRVRAEDMGAHMRKRNLWWTGIALLVLGCKPIATPAPLPTPMNQSRSGMTQQLYVQGRQHLNGATEWVTFSPEDILHTGDRYRLEVQTRLPGYLYAGRIAAERPLEILLPLEGTNVTRTESFVVVEVPAGEGQSLDKPIGEEVILLLVTDAALPAATVRQHLSAAPRAEEGDGRELPPELTEKNRGNLQFYVGKPMAPGVIGLRFSFQRQK